MMKLKSVYFAYTIVMACLIAIEILLFKNYLGIFCAINPLLVVCIFYYTPKGQTRGVASHGHGQSQIDALLNQIDHEVQTPITALKVCLETFSEQQPHNELTNHMKKSVDRLESINSQYIKLLCLKTIPSHEGEPLDLTEEVRICMVDCLNYFQANNTQYVIRIPDKPILIWGHKKLLREALRDVMKHALCNPEKKSQYFISLTAHSNSVSLTLENHGISPNINRDLLAQQVFSINPFKQNTPLGPTGLALALSKSIIEQHKGLIDYQYCGSKTTRYHITLPTLNNSLLNYPI